MTRLVLAIVLCLLPSLASAQQLDHYVLSIWTYPALVLVGTPTTIPMSAIPCGQPMPVLPDNTINPDLLIWDDPDPANVGKACIHTPDPVTGPLAILPFGAAQYIGTLVANDGLDSAPSAPSLPFTHPGVARPAPTGLRVKHR